jgi:uncharacterized protein (TIGR02391 family)
MRTLKALIPECQAVTSMHTADLAGYVLEVLLGADHMNQGVWNRRNFCTQAAKEYGTYEAGPVMDIGIACSSAWSWLETNGLICRHPEQDNDWFVATARGRIVRDHATVRQLISSEQLPETFLHPEFATNVRPLFLQSRLETAVFEAFKALEVTIRSAANFGDEMIGVPLASRAFHPEDGPLSDKGAEKGERVALMSLMTGAIGSYKNPSSHRRVAITAEEARDMIILASHLIRITEARARMVNAGA